jgi:Asp-tRNA(Asn)/Glu-tRNA(Gln) amidotransferase A subunit family amidase
VILTPGASSVSPRIQDVLNGTFKSNQIDDLLSVANFAGTPSISIPYKKINKLH